MQADRLRIGFQVKCCLGHSTVKFPCRAQVGHSTLSFSYQRQEEETPALTGKAEGELAGQGAQVGKQC